MTAQEPPADERAGYAPPPPSGAGSSSAAGRGKLPAAGKVNARQVLAAAMTEAELEEHVRVLCKDLGVLRFHVRDSRGMNRGLPDDILIGARGVVLWRECKTQRGRLTPEQREIGEALTALGQDYGVWRPISLLNGHVGRELTAISRLAGAA